MPDVHARLSASASSKWLNCTNSLLLEEEFDEKESPYAEEGTLAHALAEIKVKKYFVEGIGPKTYKKEVDKLKESEYWDNEMENYTTDYLDYLKQLSLGFKSNPYVAIEKKVSYDKYAKEGFGTCDCLMIEGNNLHICDLKYGKGVPVSAEKNSQLMLYALGAYTEYSFLYRIDNITLHIIQPRLDNYSRYEFSVTDLLAFGEVVKEKSQIALSGNGEFKTGPHCKFCKAKSKCRARSEENIKLAGFTKMMPPLSTDDEVGDYLAMAQDIVNWVKDLEEYALNQCLAGNTIKGWKVVEGRSVRKVVDEIGLINKLKENGFDEALIYKPKQLETITNLEKLVGKKPFAELSKDFIEKPKGKPTLVRESDKRETITNSKKAKDVFKEEI